MDKSKEINGISCEVTNCKFHDKSNCCCAGHIQVGHTYAKQADETVCETFQACENGCN